MCLNVIVGGISCNNGEIMAESSFQNKKLIGSPKLQLGEQKSSC